MIVKNIVITSHSKRMRLFIGDYFYNFNKDKKFMNCAVILINTDILNPKETKIKMIYRGEIDNNEDKDLNLYYDIDEFNNLNLKSTRLIVPPGLNIYIIRHAQGFHNLNNTIAKRLKAMNNKEILKDPQLTLIGHNQAKNAGKFLIQNYPEIKNNTLYFCSVLLRTRETISNILGELNLSNQEVIILPCSHEISNFKLPEELIINTGKCKDSYCSRLVYKCDFINNNNNIHNFNWDYYNKLNVVNICKLTNMLYKAYIIYAMILNKDEKYINNLKKRLQYYA
jgi:hypothetical protein